MAINITHYLEILVGPIGIEFVPKNSKAKAFRDVLAGKALPFGDFHLELIGSRSIKVLPLPSNDESLYSIVYTKYFPASEAPASIRHANQAGINTSQRGYVRGFVISISENDFRLKLQNRDWISSIFSDVIEHYKDELDLSWIASDLEKHKKAIPTIKISFPKQITKLVKRGGCGLSAHFKSAQDWLLMEEIIRQLVLRESKQTGEIVSFSTLSPSSSEITKIFAVPNFDDNQNSSMILPKFQIIESSTAYNKSVKTGKYIIFAIFFIFITCGLIILSQSFFSSQHESIFQPESTTPEIVCETSIQVSSESFPLILHFSEVSDGYFEIEMTGTITTCSENIDALHLVFATSPTGEECYKITYLALHEITDSNWIGQIQVDERSLDNQLITLLIYLIKNPTLIDLVDDQCLSASDLEELFSEMSLSTQIINGVPVQLSGE